MTSWGALAGFAAIVAVGDAGDPGAPYLKVTIAKDEPASVESVAKSDSGKTPGGLVVTVRNNGPRTIAYASYVLARADCPGVPMVVGQGLAFGSSDYVAPVNKKLMADDPPLAPGDRFKLAIPQTVYEKYARLARSKRCPPGSRPELTLRQVAFTDGSGWEGFAAGPEHSEWWGRAWVPKKYPR